MVKAQVWFKPLRGSYIATNYKGALSYLPYIAYLIASAIVPLKYLKPWPLALFMVIPNWLVATSIMTAFAKHRSS